MYNKRGVMEVCAFAIVVNKGCFWYELAETISSQGDYRAYEEESGVEWRKGIIGGENAF